MESLREEKKKKIDEYNYDVSVEKYKMGIKNYEAKQYLQLKKNLYLPEQIPQSDEEHKKLLETVLEKIRKKEEEIAEAGVYNKRMKEMGADIVKAKEKLESLKNQSKKILDSVQDVLVSENQLI